MSDLVERLRRHDDYRRDELHEEAADEIERLRTEVYRLSACKFPDSFRIATVQIGDETWATCRPVASEIERLRHRVEELRGLCKWASGRLFEAGQIDDANKVLQLIGDMEP